MIETTSHIFLIMEYVKGGNLKSLIEQRKKQEKPFTMEEIRKIMKGTVKAVQYLHQNDIVHRDIKPGSIFFLKIGYLKKIKYKENYLV
jgi:serine/threonine protein kinase